MFRKVLIANRGEIAVRVIRACRELGISPIAVYSDGDQTALHVRLADEAYSIGPASATESYLNVANILAAAKTAGAEAIHPGYGFLSESEAFASACKESGLVFIGPPPDVMSAMGDKVAARRLAAEVGVPTVPGAAEPLPDDPHVAADVAADIGYPLLLKAAGGGGGKGMRAVSTPDELPAALERARGEATAAFSDSRVYAERQVLQPRHVEVQILADTHGNVHHLGERDCSVQRRFQKLIEESPAPGLSEMTRQALWEAAVRLARAAGYVGAGTVEFLVEPDDSFYFLEVNARLQVEHPVTEAVLGVDLVHEQVRIAAGEHIAPQITIPPATAAIEARIYAEDADRDFMPSVGTVDVLREPAGPWIRVDSGCFLGQEVTVYYDSLLAKVVAWGPDREAARVRLHRALGEYRLAGVATTVPFLRDVLADPEFAAARLSTSFLAEYQQRRRAQADSTDANGVAAVGAALHMVQERTQQEPAAEAATPRSRWQAAARREALRP
ncbi:MAG: hypothetical protein CL878_09685 [Dehalococcoidia bacterium]|nr:hypothetical protein [Dehalococcoidia bacterium]